MHVPRRLRKKIPERNAFTARRKFNFHRGLVRVVKHQAAVVQNMIDVRVAAREQFILFPTALNLSRAFKGEPMREVLVVAPKPERRFVDDHFSLKPHLITQRALLARENGNRTTPVRRGQSPGVLPLILRSGG